MRCEFHSFGALKLDQKSFIIRPISKKTKASDRSAKSPDLATQTKKFDYVESPTSATL